MGLTNERDTEGEREREGERQVVKQTDRELLSKILLMNKIKSETSW